MLTCDREKSPLARRLVWVLRGWGRATCTDLSLFQEVAPRHWPSLKALEMCTGAARLLGLLSSLHVWVSVSSWNPISGALRLTGVCALLRVRASEIPGAETLILLQCGSIASHCGLVEALEPTS